MIEIKQLLVFRACVEEGSFSRAAETLSTTQSNVSKIIHSLEKNLGMSLLTRNSKGVTPTDKGSMVFEYSKIVLSTISNIESISEESEECTLRIASTHNRYISQKLTEYRTLSLSGGFTVDFWTGNFHHVVHRVDNGDSSIGILSLPERNLESFRDLMSRKGISFHPLNFGRESLYVGPKSPFYNEKIITRDMLSQMKLIARGDYEYMLPITNKNEFYTTAGTGNNHYFPVLITNDYIATEELVSSTDMVHHSFSMDNWHFPMGDIRCIPIENGEPILCGYIQKSDYRLPQIMTNFLSCL